MSLTAFDASLATFEELLAPLDDEPSPPCDWSRVPFDESVVPCCGSLGVLVTAEGVAVVLAMAGGALIADVSVVDPEFVFVGGLAEIVLAIETF